MSVFKKPPWRVVRSSSVISYVIIIVLYHTGLYIQLSVDILEIRSLTEVLSPPHFGIQEG